MSFEKFKTDFDCVGGRRHSSTRSLEGDVTLTGQKILIGKCVHCGRKTSKIICYNTIAAKGMDKAFEHFRETSAKAG